MFKDPKYQFYYDELRRRGWTHHRAMLYVSGQMLLSADTLRKLYSKKK